MSVPQKHTKPNVPNLRFPGFEGEWVSSSLGEKGNPYNGLSGKSATDFGEGSQFITYKSIFDNSRVDIHRNGLVNITDREREKGTQNQVRKGDIFFTVSSETPDEVGMSSVLLDDVDDCYLNSFCFGYRLADDNVRPEFLRFYLRSPKIRRKIAILAQGSTRFNISKDEIMNMPIRLPFVKEQEKLAEFLNLIEERIALQNKVIEDLKQLKTAISRIVFNHPVNRRTVLRDLIVTGKAGGTPTSSNKTYYNCSIPFLSINDISKQGKYITYTENHLSEAGLRASSAWLVPAGSLILSMYASVGLPAINKVPLATSQAMFAMVLKQPSMIDYLYYYLCFFKERFIYRFLETGTQSNINAEIVRTLEIPDYGEKNIMIGKILSKVDERIVNEENTVSFYNQQKSYLMCKMFI